MGPLCWQRRGLPLVSVLVFSREDPLSTYGLQAQVEGSWGVLLGEKGSPTGRHRPAGGDGPLSHKGLMACHHPRPSHRVTSVPSEAFSLGLAWSPGSKSGEAESLQPASGSQRKRSKSHEHVLLLLFPENARCAGCPHVSRVSTRVQGVQLCPGCPHMCRAFTCVQGVHKCLGHSLVSRAFTCVQDVHTFPGYPHMFRAFTCVCGVHLCLGRSHGSRVSACVQRVHECPGSPHMSRVSTRIQVVLTCPGCPHGSRLSSHVLGVHMGPGCPLVSRVFTHVQGVHPCPERLLAAVIYVGLKVDKLNLRCS